MGFVLLTHSGAMTTNFRNGILAPYVYIELPLGSSRRELRFWEMGYWLLTYSGAITKNFRSLQAISALQVRFLCLLRMYILSSLQGAPGGSSVFGKWDIGSSHIQELSQKISEAYKQYLLCKLDFCVCSLCIYLAPSWELKEEELHFSARVFGLLINQGAHTKNFRAP